MRYGNIQVETLDECGVKKRNLQFVCLYVSARRYSESVFSGQPQGSISLGYEIEEFLFYICQMALGQGVHLGMTFY